MANKILKDEETGERFEMLTPLENAQARLPFDICVFLKRIPPPNSMPTLMTGDVVRSPHGNLFQLRNQESEDRWNVASLNDELLMCAFGEQGKIDISGITIVLRDGKLLWKKDA